MPALRLAETCEVEFLDAGNFGSPFSATPVGQEGFLQGGGPWVTILYEASEKFSGGGIEQMALLVEFGAFFFAIGPEQRGTDSRKESKVKSQDHGAKRELKKIPKHTFCSFSIL